MSYVEALETRVRWLRWCKEGEFGNRSQLDQMAKHPYSQHRAILPAYEDVLEGGDTFYMNKQFCELVDVARDTIPDELAFDSTWMQARQGFMWLETPFNVPLAITDEKGETKGTDVIVDRVGTQLPGKDRKAMRISAIGWKPIPEGTKASAMDDPDHLERIVGKGAYHFLCFQDFSRYEQGAVGFGCWSYFMLQEGDKIINRINDFEGMAVKTGGGYLNDRTRDMLHEIRWVYAAFYLMAQKLAMTIKKDTDRSTRRRHENTPTPVTPFYRVVTLRRLEADRKKAGGQNAPVDWQWQWQVRGHWRNQFYKSTGEWKPIFIESFIKGPQGKPLKPDSMKIFVAKR